MQESAQAAMSYVRSRARVARPRARLLQKVDIHVHFPEGAIPKDGPSAGITMATRWSRRCCASRCGSDVAMTGEITLRGRVLPIGGLKEKILAAHRAGITTVIIPKENAKDLRDIPQARAQDDCASSSSSTWTRCCARRSLLPQPGGVPDRAVGAVDWRQPAERRERERAARRVVAHAGGQRRAAPVGARGGARVAVGSDEPAVADREPTPLRLRARSTSRYRAAPERGCPASASAARRRAVGGRRGRR